MAIRCRKTETVLVTNEPELRLSESEEQFCRCGKFECIAHAEGDTGSLQAVSAHAVETPASGPLPLSIYRGDNGVSS